MKDLKCQVPVRVLLRKHKKNKDIEFALTFFNSTTKTVINSKCRLDDGLMMIWLGN